LKNIHFRPPITPHGDGAYTRVNPMMNQRIDRIIRPEKVCINVEREFLLLSKPASKKPRAGIINSTSPVEMSTHDVSPGLIANTG
jgi:hypothetical protein